MFDLRSLLDFRESWNRRIIRLTGSMRKSRGGPRQTGSHGQDYRQDPITSWKALSPRAFILSRVFSSKSAYPWINYQEGGETWIDSYFFLLSRSNLTYILNPNNDSNSKRNTLRVIYHLLNSSSQQAFPISSVPF